MYLFFHEIILIEWNSNNATDNNNYIDVMNKSIDVALAKSTKQSTEIKDASTCQSIVKCGVYNRGNRS